MTASLTVLSPLQGWCAGLDDNPDPVFSGRMLGDGVSIDPLIGELRAPFDGEVLTVPDSRHAVNLRAPNGAEFLVHIGVDTVSLAGEGFEALVKAGDRVVAGQPLVRFDLDRLVREATSLRTPVLLLQSDGYSIRDMRAEGPVEFGETLFEVESVEADRQAVHAAADEKRFSQRVFVGLEHGIHARPAALMGDAIKGLDARVTCAKGAQQADARSPVALMSLGVARGDEVEVSATGPDAVKAVEAFIGHLEPGEKGSGPDSAEQKSGSDLSLIPASAVAPEEGAVLSAQAASPGLALGRSFRLVDVSLAIRKKALSVDEETAELDSAIQAVREHLENLVRSESGPGSEIASAHLALLDDPLMVQTAADAVEAGQSAPSAWQQATQSALETLSKVSDPRLRERMDDLQDINLRVQRSLSGGDPGQGPAIPEECVLLAENLLPSQLLELDRKRLHGIALVGGGATSHVAILAMSLGIPLLVAAGDSLLGIEDGQTLMLDAELGELHYQPGQDAVELFKRRIADDRHSRASELEQAGEPCVTKEGVRIQFLANIASADEAADAVAAGAEGCGLLRTEFIFMGRSAAPGLEEQVETYQHISDALGERPMVVRTLDAGGDKPIAYLNQSPEENPALGVRGIRLGLDRDELLRTQLEALLRVQHPVPLQVMIPMVSSVDEVLAVREHLQDLGWKPGEPDSLRLGIMIETPAAAMLADRLAKYVDFFSIGTNDLCQYTLCMDRGDPRLATQLDVLHPAVLQLIGNTARAAQAAHIDVAVCGGAAGDILAAPILLGLGVRELSMPGRLVARQKARIRKWSIEHCEELANRSVAMETAGQVRALVRDRLAS